MLPAPFAAISDTHWHAQLKVVPNHLNLDPHALILLVEAPNVFWPQLPQPWSLRASIEPSAPQISTE
jgi:hypothetical protein